MLNFWHWTLVGPGRSGLRVQGCVCFLPGILVVEWVVLQHGLGNPCPFLPRNLLLDTHS